MKQIEKKLQNKVLKVILKHRLKIQKYTLRYVTSKSNIILNNIITSVIFNTNLLYSVL